MVCLKLVSLQGLCKGSRKGIGLGVVGRHDVHFDFLDEDDAEVFLEMRWNR